MASAMFEFGKTPGLLFTAAEVPSESKPLFVFGTSQGAKAGGLFGGPPIFSSPAVSSAPFTAATSSCKTVSSTGANLTSQEEGEDENPEEEVTTIPGWAASVTLDILEKVETGEEEEEEIYSQRAKLYRFKDGEWKERGLGDAKLMKHRKSTEIRFLLRQERTQKVVANHYVFDCQPYCDLQPNKSTDRCLVWSAIDSSDENVEMHRFAIRLKTEELVSKFQDAFNEAKLHNSALPKFRDLCGSCPSVPSQEPFKKAEQSEASTAPAGKSETTSSPSGPSSAGGPFRFGITGTGATEGAKSSPAAVTGGLFGGLIPPVSGQLLGKAPGASPLFGDLLKPAAGSAFSGNSSGAVFSDLAATASGGGDHPDADGEEEGEAVEEEVTAIPGWSSSISLEVKDSHETGEEDEEELYSQRSKLLRFRDGEWKERGLGDAKLLRHKESRKVRFILRQEKTLKLAANHYVIDFPPYCDLQRNAGSQKIWVWSAKDCSDDEPSVETFALKFLTEEHADAFREAFQDAKAQNAALELAEEGPSKGSAAAVSHPGGKEAVTYAQPVLKGPYPGR